MKTAVVIGTLMAAATAEYAWLVHKVHRSCLPVTTQIQQEIDYFLGGE